MLAIPHGTFCFMCFPGDGWYVSCTATLLFTSYILHNIIAWLRDEPFFIGASPTYFSRRTSKAVRRVCIGTLAATVPVWIFNAYNNFLPMGHQHQQQARPCTIGRSYGLSAIELVGRSAKLGIALIAIVFAATFTIVDVVATILEGGLGPVHGINPWWKFALVFKCLTDPINLDDFATELRCIGGERSFPMPGAVVV